MDYVREGTPAMKLSQLVDTSTQVRATRSRKKKTALLAAMLRELAPHERRPGALFIAGVIPQGKIGVGYATLKAVADTPTSAEASLDVGDVDRVFDQLAGESGPGSVGRRNRALGELLGKSTAAEREFLLRLCGGELRQGASEGLLVEAIAAVSEIDPGAVRRAAMVAGDVGEVAQAALGGGAAALHQFRITLFRPLLPMLAQPVESVDDVYATFDDVVLDLKLDGARIQAHKSGPEVRVYSRGLHDVTAAVPEVVAAVAALEIESAILDGEAIALRDDGRPHKFQATMARFSRKKNTANSTGPALSSFFFDALLIDGQDLLDHPARERFSAMAGCIPPAHIIERITPASREETEAFVRAALERGHEGVMAKSLSSSYAAGARGASWLKLKPVYTFDLVVLAAEWGSGRRKGWLSNIHLGARDPGSGEFVMLGKTFKGMTDKLLAWQTDKFLELERGRDGHVVWVKPELVVEVAIGGVLASPHYPAGLALRFARVKRYRTDKRAAEADTIDSIRALYAET